LGIRGIGCLWICTAGALAALPIPESEMVALEQTLVQDGDQDTSPISARRTLKNSVRKGLALVDASPEASNRFDVLGIVFQCQKRLIAVDTTEQNRTALFETCEKLAMAPDTYAALRLEADILLSDRDLSAKDATLATRAEALAALIERYRGTSAEARSLLMGALIVQKLDAPELEDAILRTLNEDFADDAEVIEFRSKHLKASRMDVLFKGNFKRVDGVTLSFPSDTIGHMSLMVFWSKDNPAYENYFSRLKESLVPFPGIVDVFSINVDELPDGGESILREQGVDWTVLCLPEGRNSMAYRAYANNDLVAVLVNEYGMAVIRPAVVHGNMRIVDLDRVSDARYSAQLQSLFIGDFLVQGQLTSNTPPTSVLQSIEESFLMYPFRYRFTANDALTHYTKMATLCAEALNQKPESPDARSIRDRRIIALLGMWNQACEPKYLEQAVTEAAAALSTTQPMGADVVPRFCLAKAALRMGDKNADTEVARFLDDCGGSDAPASVLAAASILALEAKSKELHEQYRGLFLEKYADDPAFYAFTSFLRDRHHQYRLLKANHIRSEGDYPRGHIVHRALTFTNALPEIELKKLDGSPFILPKETNGKLTYLLFVEPPADPTADFPVLMDPRGWVSEYDYIRRVMRIASDLTESHVNKDIQFVTAFLTDDVDHVRFLVKTNAWNCQAVIVPQGLKNPMVRQLGILSADQIPNVFLLRRDGSVAWYSSGLRYQSEFAFPYAFSLAMKTHVENCDVETGYKMLENGDYQNAVRYFTVPFSLVKNDHSGWHSPSYYGKALGYMGLGAWDGALEAIDNAIDAHKLHHFQGRRKFPPAEWQKDAATVVIKETCDTLKELWSTKITILEKLGRRVEADALRKLCEQPLKPHTPNVYNEFNARLTELSMKKKLGDK